MRKVVMLLAVLLGTGFMVNANPIATKTTASKEAKVVRKHRRARKAHAAKTKAEAAKPMAKAEK